MLYESDVLEHHGIKGQKWGVRRYQNPDGTLTEEGRRRYLSSLSYQQRRIYDSWDDSHRSRAEYKFSEGKDWHTAVREMHREDSDQRRYRVRRDYGEKTGGLLSGAPKKFTSRQQAELDARRKKIIAVAAGVTLASIGIGIAIHRRNKINRNLIEMAKNSVSERYRSTSNLMKTAEDRAKHESWRSRDILSIHNRKSALKELHLDGWKNRDRLKSFVKDNNLARVKTSRIVEQRTGKLVEGYRRSRLTGKMKPYTERYRRKRAEQIVRGWHS